MGGLTELLKLSAMASAYDIPIVPHGSGPYSYHAISECNSACKEARADDGVQCHSRKARSAKL